MPLNPLSLLRGAGGDGSYKQISTGAVQLLPSDNFCEVALPAGGTLGIILPPMATAVGVLFFVRAVSLAGAGHAVLVSAESNSAGTRNYTSDALTAVDDILIMVTDGKGWYPLYNVTT